jgi:hypothetical protein
MRGWLAEFRAGVEARVSGRDDAGVLLAEATGKFMPVPGELQDRVLSDFVADPGAWLDRHALRGA